MSVLKKRFTVVAVNWSLEVRVEKEQGQDKIRVNLTIEHLFCFESFRGDLPIRDCDIFNRGVDEFILELLFSIILSL